VNFTPFHVGQGLRTPPNSALEAAASAAHGAVHAPAPNWSVMIMSSIIAVVGILIAVLIYHYKIIDREKIRTSLRPIHTLLTNKYYMDELAEFIFLRCGYVFIKMLRWFDNNIIDGLVNLVGWLGVVWSTIEGWTDKWIVDGLVNLIGIIVRQVGGIARLFQTGYLQNYVFIILIGLLLILLLK
jgi:NADH-quinone oxidoreductase subunit L